MVNVLVYLPEVSYFDCNIVKVGYLGEINVLKEWDCHICNTNYYPLAMIYKKK